MKPTAGRRQEAADREVLAGLAERWSKLDEWLAGAKDDPQERPLHGPPLTGAVP